MSLFAPVTEQKKDVLIEFKAGQMFKENNSKWVYPDKRKGLIILKQSPEDGLMHFMWKDRTTGVIERDLIVFPGDVVFKRVKECTTGRVYVLEFNSSSQKFFFWMQDAKEDKDNEICEKVNQLINNPPSQTSGSEELGMLGATIPAIDPSLLGNLSQSQLLELLAGGQNFGSASNTQRRGSSTSTSSSTSSNQQRRAQILQSVLQQSLSQAMAMSTSAQVRLNDIFNVDDIVASGVLNDPEVQQHLLTFLPEHDRQRATQSGHTPLSVLIETLRSPQFVQAVRIFHQAIESGQYGGPQGQMAGLLRSFGLDPSKLPAESASSSTSSPTSAQLSAVEAFLRAIQQLHQKEKKNDTSSSSSTTTPPTAKK